VARPIAPDGAASGLPRVLRQADRDYFVIAVGLLAILAVWIPPMWSSLWLDETGTFWVIRGDVRDAVHRALDFQGQFPLYHVLLWGWSKLAGTSEFSLRLPSLLAAFVATWLCYRLAIRLFDDAAVARLAACVFVLLRPVAFAAVDARPYALAIASLLGAILALARWLRSDRVRDAVAFVGLVALTLYLHYLFALALVPLVMFAYRPVREKGHRAAVVVAASLGGLVLLLIPAMPHLLDVIGRRQAMSLFTFGSVPDILAWVAPPMIVVAVIAGRYFPLAADDDDDVPNADATPRRVLAFLGVWVVLPPLILFLAGQISGIGLYAERHFLSSVPAVAMLAAIAFGRLSQQRQRIGLAVLAMLLIVGYASSYHSVSEDWRGAALAANELSDGPRTPILVYTGFSESTQMDRVLDPEQSRLFLAPLAAYPVEGRPFPLPFELTDAGKEYVEAILASEAPEADRIILITSERTRTYDVWLEERTAVVGFVEHFVGQFGDVRVLMFQRRGDEA
jgi:hypothetical protein